jgi:DNA primase small subunit
VPARIELGPMYNVDPQKRGAYTGNATGTQSFQPEQRELLFDIDLNVYDDVRSCCKESSICTLCWQLIAVCSVIFPWLLIIRVCCLTD